MGSYSPVAGIDEERVREILATCTSRSSI